MPCDTGTVPRRRLLPVPDPPRGRAMTPCPDARKPRRRAELEDHDRTPTRPSPRWDLYRPCAGLGRQFGLPACAAIVRSTALSISPLLERIPWRAGELRSPLRPCTWWPCSVSSTTSRPVRTKCAADSFRVGVCRLRGHHRDARFALANLPSSTPCAWPWDVSRTRAPSARVAHAFWIKSLFSVGRPAMRPPSPSR